MKNWVLFIFVVLFSTNQISAQGELNLGIGLLPTYLGTSNSKIPPLMASYDHPFQENITIGGYIGYSTAEFVQSSVFLNYSIDYSYVLIGARGTYHFEISNEKIDPYIGLHLGYNVVSTSINGCDDPIFCDALDVSASSIGYAGLLGAKYQMSENLKLFGEVGYGVSILSFGITLDI